MEEFSATLNIVPVVGLKNNQVVYINTKLDEISATHLKDEWTFFSSLPAGAQPGAGKKVHFFPFNGHLCMSVGTAVWRKKHRDQKDPALQQAADDWPKMYHDDWEKIGDKALPAPDLAAIVPFVEAQKDKTLFHLVILTKDGTVQVLNSDDIHASNTWGTLSCSGVEGGSRSSPPTLKHMAYWNDMAYCIDDQGHSWNARVSFGDKTYKLSDKKQTGPVLELTATEMGPVVLRDDGYLYQRVVENPTSDGADPVLEWKRWIKADGATSLGVASPGVQLDLRLLTRILKDRYITAQSSLVVPLQRIKTFAKSHVTLCDTLLKLTEDYRNADDDTQMELALQAGQELIYTAKPWARKMSQETASGYDTVTIMTSQLKGVKQQLAQQLQILRDKLEGLERLMKTQEEQLSQLKAYFWAAVSAMFLGTYLRARPYPLNPHPPTPRRALVLTFWCCRHPGRDRWAGVQLRCCGARRRRHLRRRTRRHHCARCQDRRAGAADQRNIQPYRLDKASYRHLVGSHHQLRRPRGDVQPAQRLLGRPQRHGQRDQRAR